jgi:hypothetical protein
VRFDGLPSRIPYGPQRAFTLTETFDNDLDGSIAVRMADAATDRAFFTGDAAADDELYLQFDLDDGPVTVSATFTQSDPLAPDTSACQMTLTRTVRGYRHLLLPSFCGGANYRPRTVVLTCGDAGYLLRSLAWRGWNHAAASARGRAWANDCVPFCAGGTFRRYRMRARAYRIRRCAPDGDRYVYTRLTITYPGTRPAGEPVRSAWRMPCVSA